ncbi:MAG: stage III sporulation protein AF [Tissierella sp.]|nr:stage III sporulation protein AF [Tissierella sp.]
MGISEFIFSWLKDIVLLFIIITLVDLVMPKGGMRRYINFVVGLLIIFTVINPFINLTNLNFELDREVFRNVENKSKYDEEILNSQNEQIETLYRQKIATEIKSFIESNLDYRISSLEVDINREEDDFGTISHLSILIDDNDKEVDENNIAIQVQPVTLEYNTRMEKNKNYLDLKELISDRYEIHGDLIDISTIKLED